MAVAADGIAPPDEEKQARSTQLARWVSDVRAILAAVALAAYLFLRIAYNSFYSAFGLSPEDLGFDYLDILTQSAVGALLLLVVAAAVVAIVPMGLGTVAVGRGHVGISGLLVAVIAFAWIAIEREWAVGHPLAVVIFGGLAWRGAAVARAGVSSSRVARGHRVSALWRGGVTVTAAAVFVVAGYLLLYVARTDANRVAHGLPARPTFSGIPLASWHADAATISGSGNVEGGLRALEGRCLMYLGEHDGTAFLADRVDGRSQTLRLSARDVVVRLMPGRRCEGGRVRS